MVTILLGAGLVTCGIVVLVWEVLGRRPLSDPHRSSPSVTRPTLEPRRQGMRFLGLTKNWLGVSMIAAGAIILLAVAAS